MKRISLLTILFVLGGLLCSSCNKTLIDDTHNLNNSKWMRFEAQQFQFNVKNTDDCYHIVLTVNVDTSIYTERTLPLVVNMTSEGGETRMFYSNIKLKDKKGNRFGTLVGNYQTASTRIRSYMFFNHKGQQTIAIKQGTSKYELPGIASVNLRVEKAKLELPE